MNEFEVGQTVSVISAVGDIIAVTKIQKITPRQIILSSGMKFNDRGVQWGFSNSYGGSTIRPSENGDRETIRRRNMITRIKRVDWNIFTSDQLAQVYEIVKSND